MLNYQRVCPLYSTFIWQWLNGLGYQPWPTGMVIYLVGNHLFGVSIILSHIHLMYNVHVKYMWNYRKSMFLSHISMMWGPSFFGLHMKWRSISDQIWYQVDLKWTSNTFHPWDPPPSLRVLAVHMWTNSNTDNLSAEFPKIHGFAIDPKRLEQS